MVKYRLPISFYSLVSSRYQKKKRKKRGIDIFWPFFVEEPFGMSCLVKNSASFGRALLGGIRASLKASLAC